MENLLGQKFGRLTVIKFAGIRKIKSKTPRRKHILTYYWECRCDCGNKATVTAGNLKAKNVKSCGCQIAISNRARTLPNGEAAFGCLFRRYRKQAIGRGLCFNLSKKLSQLYLFHRLEHVFLLVFLFFLVSHFQILLLYLP